MRKNHISAIRREILASFSEKNLLPDLNERFVSGNGEYSARQYVYQQADNEHNWQVSKIEVLDRADQIIATLMIDNEQFFHHWLLTEQKSYLLYAENMCGGNSVLNLETLANNGYSDGTDGFITVEYIPSADCTHMAVIGSYWGTPYVIRVFDSTSLESLPWPMIQEIHLDDSETEVEWVDRRTLRVFRRSNKDEHAFRDVMVGF